jgi:Kef-type K+ transport system membrane component KefB
MGTAFGMGAILLVAAILRKVIADGVPVSLLAGANSGILIGASMVPRAEIAMLIMQRGLRLGEWAVPNKVYAAMVVVSAATCTLSPLVVRSLLKNRSWKGETS